MRFRWAVALLTLPIIGCATNRAHNLSQAVLLQEPAVYAHSEPELVDRIANFTTFAVLPRSAVDEDSALNGILEKQVLFAVRNMFEARGYRFVSLADSPDFIIVTDGNAQFRTSYVPPSSVVVPKWVPGKTITNQGTSRGTFSFDVYGDIDAYGWGTYSGTTTSKTYVPGYLTTKTRTRPGYTTGHYYPSYSLVIIDGSKYDLLWSGTAVGTSNVADLRVAGQVLLVALVGQFPECHHYEENYALSDGYLGVQIGVLTNDGNNYLPAVLSVAKGSPAENAKLRKYDMITSINGTSTLNLPWSRVWELLKGKRGEVAELSIWRLRKPLDISVTRTARN